MANRNNGPPNGVQRITLYGHDVDHAMSYLHGLLAYHIIRVKRLHEGMVMVEIYCWGWYD